jgi:hypothetical protein
MAHPLLNFFEKTSDVKTINALAVFSKKIQFTATLLPGRSGPARGFHSELGLYEHGEDQLFDFEIIILQLFELHYSLFEDGIHGAFWSVGYYFRRRRPRLSFRRGSCLPEVNRGRFYSR